MTDNAQLTPKQRAELQALAELPDDRIDTSDIPEVLDWTGARRGVFYHKECEKKDDQKTDGDIDRA